MNPAVLVALIPLTWLVSRFWWTCDDAFISFRYVQHLVRGDGLTFNPGESPPVEGFTNLLWVLTLAPFESAGVPLPLIANLLSAGCAVLLTALALRLLLALGAQVSIAMVCGLFFVTLPPTAIWATSGLETMPFALAVFATYSALVLGSGTRRVVATALLALVAALLRADGALWCGFAFVAALVSCPAEQRGAMWKAVLSSGVLLTLAVAAHFAWRHSYFGEWMPNTAKVKAGFSMERAERGAKYLASLFYAAPALGLVPVAGLVLWRTLKDAALFGRGALVFVAFSAAYAIYVGGDFMAMGRFTVPAMPFLALILGALSIHARRPALAMVGGVVVTLVGVAGCFDVLPIPDSALQAVHFRWNGPRARSEVAQWAFMKKEVVTNSQLGRALAMHTLPGESLVRGNIGAVGYFSEIVLLDINGLVTPAVLEAPLPSEPASPGHDRRVDPSFFDSWEPTYIYAAVLPSSIPARQAFGAFGRSLIRAGKLKVERFKLNDRDGFEPGTELRLLRDLRHAEKTHNE